jgi:hypothetical protein
MLMSLMKSKLTNTSITMLQLRMIIPRLRPTQLASLTRQATPIQSSALPRSFRRSLEKSLQQAQLRFYAVKPTAAPKKHNNIEDELKRQARAVAKDGKEFGAYFSMLFTA